MEVIGITERFMDSIDTFARFLTVRDRNELNNAELIIREESEKNTKQGKGILETVSSGMDSMVSRILIGHWRWWRLCREAKGKCQLTGKDPSSMEALQSVLL